MKRRLVIARAMINNPRLLILDEPTTGLDPQARHLIWQRLRELKRRGVTMILSTHYMEEAEQLCDRLALMDSGLIVEEGNPQELIKRYVGKEVFEVRYAEPRKVLSLLCGLSFKHEVAGDTMYIYSQDGQEIGKRLMEMPDAEILHRRANLEDVFFRLTGKDLKD
jgi:lipooligosaccharide transport system ATP-binding protein